MWILLCTISLLTTISFQLELAENQPCQSNRGTCKKFRDCPWAREAFLKGINPEICSISGAYPVICCLEVKETDMTSSASNTSETQVKFERTQIPKQKGISKRKCAEYAQYVFELQDSPIGDGKLNVSTCGIEVHELIVGGTPAKPKEFPHMALIGFGNNSDEIRWICGGSLISEEFVLSAAHCSQVPSIGPASWAMLGELDLSDDEDATPITLKIVERIKHPDYNYTSVYNDIALFRLERKVVFSSHIRPICLHDGRDLPHSAIATGWGRTDSARSSHNLQRVTLSFVAHETCSKLYKKIKRRFADGLRESTQFCAGENGRDSCQGDSGGPLQIPLQDPYCMYMQVGITSFGKICGSLPGVYTRVSPFVDWIENIVWSQ